MLAQMDDARNHVNEALEIFKECDDSISEGNALVLSARIHDDAKAPDLAREAARQALAVFRRCGDEAGERIALELIDSFQGDQSVRFDPITGEPLDGSGPIPVFGHRRALQPVTPGGDDSLALAGKGFDPVVVRECIQSVTKQIVGAADDVEADQPLMDIGVTSMTAVMFRQNLGSELEAAGIGAHLPVTLIFDYPSVAAIADMLVS